MKKIILSMVLAVLLLSTVCGTLVIDAKPLRNTIYMDEYATFSIQITNPDTVSKAFQIYSTDVEFYSSLEPLVSRIGPNETLALELQLFPTAWAETGSFGVGIFVESTDSDDKLSLEFPVYIKTFDTIEKQYNPSVELKASMPERIDPKEDIPIEVYIRNRNKLDIEAVDISVESGLFKEYRSVPLSPYPEGERSENFVVKLDKLTPPQQDIVEVNIRVGNKTINKERLPFEIISYTTFSEKEEASEEVFKTIREYTILNEGNIKKKEAFRVKTSILRRIFTSTSPPASYFNFRKTPYIEWELELGPMEEAKIEVVENYRSIIYLVLAAIVITAIYFLYRSPVIVKKESLITAASNESISEMKVLLHIRNRSQDLMEHIKVTDMIPSIAELVKEAHIGTLPPIKIIRNDKKGTIIKWEIEALEPFEERIISYRSTSKIAIVGGITLPPAKIKFSGKNGKERNVRSNPSQVSLGL